MKFSSLVGENPMRGKEDPEIRGISIDSREVKRGDLFVAIRGRRFDGHQFIRDVERKCAAAIAVEKEVETYLPYVVVEDSREFLSFVSSKFYENPGEDLFIIGITGTNGKTTCSFLIHHVLQEFYGKCGLVGTIFYDTGKRKEKASKTTPEANLLHSLLKEMKDSGTSHAAIEVSSHALSQKRVMHIGFDIVIFTNLSREHLDYHGNMENYLRAKLEIFNLLRGKAILNRDDPYFPRITREVEGEFITFGKSENSSLRGEILRYSIEGMEIRTEGIVREDFKIPLVGIHNMYNFLAVLPVFLELGIPINFIRESILRFKGIPGRLERITEPFHPFQVIVDYAHTPHGFRNVLSTVRKLCKRKIISLFGAGGGRDRGKRPLMGSIAEEFSDIIILTTDNPREEDPVEIIKDIRSGMKKIEPLIIPNRKEAIERAIKMAKEGDFVLLLGKGHEDYQEIDGVKHFHSDREEAKRILNKL